MANAKHLFPFILKWEGGFVNDPADRGGATNKGITLATLTVWNKTHNLPTPTIADLKAITDEQVFEIFYQNYWQRFRADKILSQKVANCLVDWLWLSGQPAITRTQRIVGTTADGIVGPKTINAINKKDEKWLITLLYSERVAFIGEICDKRPANLKFRNGWINRLNALKKI